MHDSLKAAGVAPRYNGLLLCSAWDLKRYTRGDGLKFSDGSSKLLSGHKFQDKYAVLSAETLRLYRDIKVRLIPPNQREHANVGTAGIKRRSEGGPGRGGA